MTNLTVASPLPELIQAANTLVPLAEILADFGIEVQQGDESRSVKSYCPFQFEHPNPLDRNFRFYPSTNTAYCFEMHGLLTPVNLTVMAKDCSLKEAALHLLEPRGHLRPKPYKERWRQMMLERDAKMIIDTQGIMAALHVWIANRPELAALQFTEPFQEVLAVQLESLDVIAEEADFSIIFGWYTYTKDCLETLLTSDADPSAEAVDSAPVD